MLGMITERRAIQKGIESGSDFLQGASMFRHSAAVVITQAPFLGTSRAERSREGIRRAYGRWGILLPAAKAG